MTDIEILKSLSKFLINNVANKIKLEKPPENNIVEQSYDLVNPAVYIGWVPPKNFLESYGYDIPSIVVMIDEGEDNSDEVTRRIRITFTTYDPGTTELNGKLSPNTNGYKDLLNLIGITRNELNNSPISEEISSVDKPIKWRISEQNYPYWSSEMTFSISRAPIEININNNFL